MKKSLLNHYICENTNPEKICVNKKSQNSSLLAFEKKHIKSIWRLISNSSLRGALNHSSEVKMSPNNLKFFNHWVNDFKENKSTYTQDAYSLKSHYFMQRSEEKKLENNYLKVPTLTFSFFEKTLETLGFQSVVYSKTDTKGFFIYKRGPFLLQLTCEIIRHEPGSLPEATFEHKWQI